MIEAYLFYITFVAQILVLFLFNYIQQADWGLGKFNILLSHAEHRLEIGAITKITV